MMASFLVLVLTLTILSLSANPTFSISLQFSNHNFPLENGASLLGDAHFAGDEDSVQLNRPNPLSSGIIIHKTPLKFTSSASLSSNFTFQIGNGVALVIIPADFPSKFAKNTSIGTSGAIRFLAIEFDVNSCKISSSRVSNVSKINHDLKYGVKLTSWIDYRAILKRLDVRLTKFGDPKPVEPLISYQIDLGEILKGEEVLLGLASCNEKHVQITSVYSWSFEIKEVPIRLHSIPVNPQEHLAVQSSRIKSCLLSGFMFATGCGALAALILFFVWAYVVDRKKVQGDASVCPVDFKYEKIGVIKVDDSDTGMKK